MHISMIEGACKKAPAIYKFQLDPIMTHVDVFLMVAKTRWIRQTYIPLLEQEFQLSVTLLRTLETRFGFKREHVLVDDGACSGTTAQSPLHSDRNNALESDPNFLLGVKWAILSRVG